MAGFSEMARVAVVTGVSRRKGSGFAIAQRLLGEGLGVLIHSWSAADAETSCGRGVDEMERVIDELGGLGSCPAHVEADFADRRAPGRVIDHALTQFGAVDVVIANHARQSPAR